MLRLQRPAALPRRTRKTTSAPPSTINAIKNPELHTYRAIVAGLDKFDELHALAPAVPQLRFQVEGRGGKALTGELPVGAHLRRRFLDSADARPGCALFGAAQPGRLRRQGRAGPEPQEARGPRRTLRAHAGPAGHQFRLGDVRLDCQVKIAIAKEEIPFWVNGLINGFLLTTDWCSWFKGETPKGGDRAGPRRRPPG
jgi:hypothetical protein